MVRRVIGSIAALLLCVMPATATTITIGGLSVDDQGQFSSVPGVTTVDFNALAEGTQDFVTGIASYDDVDIFDCACSGIGDLLDDTTNGARADDGSSFAIDFSVPITYFGFYWGSPDPDNVITFYNGATELFSFTGADLNSMFGVDFGLSGAAYLNIAAGPGDQPATRIVFSGGEFPFETDNHAFIAASVPEPASLLLLTSGGIGLMTRRRWKRRQ